MRKELLFAAMLSLCMTGGPLSFLSLPAAAATTQQTIKVSGVVVDQEGEPLIGATVKVKGAQTGWGGEELASKCMPSGGQLDWSSWLAAMDEATVTVSVTNNGNGTADVRCVMLGNDGLTYTQDYIGLNTVTDPNDLYFHFTVGNCHLIFE